MEDSKEEKPTHAKPVRSTRKFIRNTTVLFLAIAVGYGHYIYVSTLFENYRNFSHLSELEREMSLRTEMGFYYSYYKTVVQERPFIAGISRLMYDRIVEYPKEVNAFNRFNIHPEVIVGALYRYLEPWLNTSAHRQCHMVDRGADLTPVESCVGPGEPIMFYLQSIWILAGVMTSAIFVHATALSESILGGVLAAVQYLANHSECTRVQWAPNERENFAAPLFFLQTWLITTQLRDREKRTSFQIQVSIFIVNCLCLLFWQFTQFIFLTQTAIFFIMEQLRIIDIKTLCVFLHSHFCGLHMAVLLLQGNDMLKTSLYTSLFLVVSAYSLFFSSLRVKVCNGVDFIVESWLVLLRICIVVCASIYFKKLICDFLEVQDDNHVWDILYSKFSDYKTFHTLMYTCSAIFDYLPPHSVVNMSQTLLLPIVLAASLKVFDFWVNNALTDVMEHYKKNFKTNSLQERTELQHKGKSESRTEKTESKMEKTDSKMENTGSKMENTGSKMENVESKMVKPDSSDGAETKNVFENRTDDRKNSKSEDTDDSGIENSQTVRKRRKKTRTNIDTLEKELKPQNDNEVVQSIYICFFKEFKVDPAIFYNISQMVVFGVLAALVMRLQLLFTTQMCIVSSLLMNPKYFARPNFKTSRLKWFLWAACAALISHRLYLNVAKELSYVGEFSDVPQEELLQWVSSESSPASSFAGSMPILSSVMLSTRRPIVAHPHYENLEARQRAYIVYKTYSRFSPHDLYQDLTKLKVTYLIVERKYCYGKSNLGCSFEQIWDIEAPSYRGRPKLCHTLLTESTDHFYRVFSNVDYHVFRVHDLSVRYMPRFFDT